MNECANNLSGAGYNSKAGHDDGTETVEYTNPTLDSELGSGSSSSNHKNDDRRNYKHTTRTYVRTYKYKAGALSNSSALPASHRRGTTLLLLLLGSEERELLLHVALGLQLHTASVSIAVRHNVIASRLQYTARTSLPSIAIWSSSPILGLRHCCTDISMLAVRI